MAGPVFMPPLADCSTALKLFKDGPDDPRRNFKIFRINELRVVLVERNDNDGNIVCHLAVGAGGNDNPPEFPGLAHLTEHMYSSRNFKFDNTGRVDLTNENLIARATTFGDFTLYTSHSVSHVKFGIPKGLKGFLRLFACNAFDIKHIKRQIYLVTQEFELHRGQPDVRLRSTAGLYHFPKRGTGGFTRGNVVSYSKSVWEDEDQIRALLSGEQDMSDEDLTRIAQALQDFTEEHYQLSNCVLILQGEDLVELESIARIIWHEIENMPEGDDVCAAQKAGKDEMPSCPVPGSTGNGRKRKGSSKKTSAGKRAKLEEKPPKERERFWEPPYVNYKFNKIYYVQPPEYDDQIVLSWRIPIFSAKQFSRTKPLHYVSALLEVATEGGLIAFLTSQGFITDMRTSVNDWGHEKMIELPWSMRYKESLFSIFLSVTNKGIKERRKVIAAVLYYLYLLEPDKKIYEAIKEVRDMRIKLFGRDRDNILTATKIARSVLYPEPHNENILTDDVRLFEYEAETIQDVLDYLISPKDMHVMIMANLGMDVNQEFPNREEFTTTDGQGMGFMYGVRDFTRKELTKWFRYPNAKNMYPALAQLRKPTDKDIGFLDKDPYFDELKSLVQEYLRPQYDGQRERDIAQENFPTNRLLMIRQVQAPYPIADITLEILPPVYVLGPQLRPVMEILANMIRFRARLTNSMWLQRECVYFESSVKDTGELTVSLNGLVHLAVPMLTSILGWINSPVDGAYREAIFEATRKGLLIRINSAETGDPFQQFAADLFFRRGLYGYTPLIDTQNTVVQISNAPEAYIDQALGFCYRKCGIVALANTNIFDPEIYEDVQEQIENLPPFEPPEELPAITNPPDGRYYVWSDFEHVQRDPKQSTFRIQNPDRGSHLHCVRHWYVMHQKVWMELGGVEDEWGSALDVIRGSVLRSFYFYLMMDLAMTYKTRVVLEQCHPGKIMLAIGILSDSKRTKCSIINIRIKEAIQRGIDYISEGHLSQAGISLCINQVKRVFRTLLLGDGDENPGNYPWRYIVQVEGDSDYALREAANNPSGGILIDWMEYDPDGVDLPVGADAPDGEADPDDEDDPDGEDYPDGGEDDDPDGGGNPDGEDDPDGGAEPTYADLQLMERDRNPVEDEIVIRISDPSLYLRTPDPES